MHLDLYLDHVASDAERLAACAEAGPLDAPVAACPGWDTRELIVHTGFIHRWATHAILNAEPLPSGGVTTPDATVDGRQLAVWMRAGARDLVDSLIATDPDAPTWHPFPFEQRAWVWRRRQAHETMMHRWDAEVATSGESDLEPVMAADGLREFFEMGLPRILQRTGASVPTSSLHVHCTDDDLGDDAGEWLVWNEDGEYRSVPEHRKGDAALRGTAETLLLVVMGRADRSRLDIVGDPNAAAAWLDLPGL